MSPKQGFPDGSVINNPPAMQEIPLGRRLRFDPWIGKISQRREWQPIPLFLPGEYCGQRRLEGYSPWCCKALDTTERPKYLNGRGRSLLAPRGPEPQPQTPLEMAGTQSQTGRACWL